MSWVTCVAECVGLDLFKRYSRTVARMADYVLDSYAVLALLGDEPGSQQVAEMLEDKQNCFSLSVVNLGEIYYIVARSHGEPAALEVVSDIRGQENVTIVDATWERVYRAAQFKVHGGLSYADAFACGLAVERGAPVISGDPEFRNIKGIEVI